MSTRSTDQRIEAAKSRGWKIAEQFGAYYATHEGHVIEGEDALAGYSLEDLAGSIEDFEDGEADKAERFAVAEQKARAVARGDAAYFNAAAEAFAEMGAEEMRTGTPTTPERQRAIARKHGLR